MDGEPKFIQISMADSGIGITPEYLEKIFIRMDISRNSGSSDMDFCDCSLLNLEHFPEKTDNHKTG